MNVSERLPNADRIFLYGIVAVILFVFIYYEATALLLTFAGILLAIALNTVSAWIESRTPFNRKISYTLTLLLILALGAGTGLFLAPRLIQETGRIATIIPGSLEQVRNYLAQRAWGRDIVAIASRGLSSAPVAARAAHLATRGLQALAGLAVILVVAFFGALSPRTYVRGFIALLPQSKQQIAASILADVAYTLRWWLAGQVVPMVVLGVMTMLGLWLLDVPLAFTLGLFTGTMILIPYAGAILSEIPALLVALTAGPRTALYVLILYLGVHALEAYVLTPLVQRRAVRLPPLVTILAQLFLWTIAGVPGVLVATPLACVAMVLIKRLYLKEAVRVPRTLGNAA